MIQIAISEKNFIIKNVQNRFVYDIHGVKFKFKRIILYMYQKQNILYFTEGNYY